MFCNTCGWAVDWRQMPEELGSDQEKQAEATRRMMGHAVACIAAQPACLHDGEMVDIGAEALMCAKCGTVLLIAKPEEETEPKAVEEPA